MTLAEAAEPPVALSAIQLRDYQRNALTAIAQAVSRGLRRVLVVLPTGTGKTVVFATYLEQVVGGGGRVTTVPTQRPAHVRAWPGVPRRHGLENRSTKGPS